MNRIIIAFEGAKQRALIRETLENGGFPVRRTCVSGAEVLRGIHEMGGGIVLCGYKLPDMTADALCEDLEGAALVLVVARNDQLDFCENGDLLKLPAPFSRNELLAAVSMLKQFENHRLARAIPQRSTDEQQKIEAAKQILMRSRRIGEAEAHRLLQRMSMDAGVKMIVSARKILEGGERA